MFASFNHLGLPAPVILHDQEYRQFVIISKKACLHLNGGEIVVVKVIDMQSLCRSARGVHKLGNYIKEGRFGYVDAKQNLHVRCEKAQALQQRKIKLADKTQPVEQAVVAKAICHVEAIDDAEYELLEASVAQIAAKIQQNEAAKQRHNALAMGLSKLSLSDVPPAKAAEQCYIRIMNDIVNRMLAKWSEQQIVQEKRQKEKYLQNLIKQEEIKEQCRMKERLAYEVLSYIVKQEACQLQDYHWACLYPMQPSAQALIASA
jgi:hypothetical protein